MQLRVLDAGCGRRSDPSIPADAHVTGFDLQAEGMALDARLDERVVGDLQTTRLPQARYDLIICHDVLEHLDDPFAALENMARALRPGGDLRVGVPHVFAPKSLAAKFTPYWFHLWVYRHVFGRKHAGEPGYGPFPTVLRWTLHPRMLTARARRFGLEPVAIERVTSATLRHHRWLRLLGDHAEIKLAFRRAP